MEKINVLFITHIKSDVMTEQYNIVVNNENLIPSIIFLSLEWRFEELEQRLNSSSPDLVFIDVNVSRLQKVVYSVRNFKKFLLVVILDGNNELITQFNELTSQFYGDTGIVNKPLNQKELNETVEEYNLIFKRKHDLKNVTFSDLIAEYMQLIIQLDARLVEAYKHKVDDGYDIAYLTDENDIKLNTRFEKLGDDIVDMVEFKLVQPAEVIKSLANGIKNYDFSNTFQEYHTYKNAFFGLLAQIRGIGRGYDEFSWIIILSNVLQNVDNIYGKMRMLNALLPKELLRSFLTYRLIIVDHISEYKNILRSFYYIDHTAKSLQVVSQVMPISDKQYHKLYENEVFPYVWSLINFSQTPIENRSRIENLQDIVFLQSFLREGMRYLPHKLIEYQKAIDALDKLFDELK